MKKNFKYIIIFAFCFVIVTAVVFLSKIFNRHDCRNTAVSELSEELRFAPKYSYALEKKFLNQRYLSPPYAVFFNTPNNSQLLYIAEEHGTEPGSSTHQMIAKAFDSFSPDFVIVEGFEIGNDVIPVKLKQYLQQYLREEACSSKSNCDGAYYAAHLAVVKNIDFNSPEPTLKTVTQNLSDFYTSEDIAFYYFTQQIPQYFRERPNLTEKALPGLFKEFMSNIIRNQEYTFDEYQKWLQKNLNGKVDFNTLINTQTIAPIENGQYLQRLSSRIGIMRNANIVEMILKNITKHKRVLVVYGASHYFIEKSLLEKRLGNPVYLKDAKSIHRYIKNLNLPN